MKYFKGALDKKAASDESFSDFVIIVKRHKAEKDYGKTVNRAERYLHEGK